MKKLLAIISFVFIFAATTFPVNSEEVSSAGTYELTLTAVVEAPAFNAIDSTTGVVASAEEGVVIAGSELIVTPLSENSPEYENLGKSLEKTLSDFKAYNIGLEFGGVKNSLSGSLNLKIPIPASYDVKKLKLYYFDNNGEKIELDFKLDDKLENIVFSTDVLGLFVLGESHDNIKTGQRSIVLAACVVVSAFAVLYILYASKTRVSKVKNMK